MTTRAKFVCNQITRHQAYGTPPQEVRTVSLSPVYGNKDPNHENTKFWQASPSGSIELGCANLAAAEMFELGREYYVDFTPAPVPAEEARLVDRIEAAQ